MGIFLFSSASRPALEFAQPPIQWVPGTLSLWGKVARGMNLTAYLHLVPRLRMRGDLPPFSVLASLSGG
jgi:hypothetical protein